MAQLSNTRCIRSRLFGSLNKEMPADMDGTNFAVLFGDSRQRLLTCLHAVDRYYGRCGIVVLHSSQPLENALTRLAQNQSEGNGRRPVMQTVSVDRKNYDPLYGMDEDAIVKVIAPSASELYLDPEIASIRSGIKAYLQIMEYQFRRNPDSFGYYPYNLDRLWQLAKLPMARLKEEHLKYLPRDMAEEINGTLGRPQMQQKVSDAVGNYATVMGSHLWTPGSLTAHSRVSINQAVRDRQLISIRIPENGTEVMDALSWDLRMLTKQNVPFLTVSYGLNLAGSRSLQSLFLGERGEQRFFTGVFAETLGSIAQDKDAVDSFISHNEMILAYGCSNETQAENYVSAYGRYLRKETDRAHHTAFMLPRLIPTVGGGKTTRRVEEWNIRPEELVHLPRGVFLGGKAYRIPVLIQSFSIPGGDSYDISVSRL